MMELDFKSEWLGCFLEVVEKKEDYCSEEDGKDESAVVSRSF